MKKLLFIIACSLTSFSLGMKHQKLTEQPKMMHFPEKIQKNARNLPDWDEKKKILPRWVDCLIDQIVGEENVPDVALAKGAVCGMCVFGATFVGCVCDYAFNPKFNQSPPIEINCSNCCPSFWMVGAAAPIVTVTTLELLKCYRDKRRQKFRQE